MKKLIFTTLLTLLTLQSKADVIVSFAVKTTTYREVNNYKTTDNSTVTSKKSPTSTPTPVSPKTPVTTTTSNNSYFTESHINDGLTSGILIQATSNDAVFGLGLFQDQSGMLTLGVKF